MYQKVAKKITSFFIDNKIINDSERLTIKSQV